MGSTGAGAGGWEFSSAVSATGEPFGVGVRVGVKDDALGGDLGGEFSTFFISALSRISSRGETGAGFGDTKSTGDLALPKTLSKSV